MRVCSCTAVLKRLAIIVPVLISASFAFANNVVVDCSGATPGAFKSIGTALSTLSPQGPNSITITGTCAERVSIDGFHNLTLQGSGTAVIRPGSNPQLTLGISHSQGITVKGPLVFDGGGIGIGNSDVFLDGVTVENGTQEAGIGARDSVVNIVNSTVNNSGFFAGILVGHGDLTLGEDTVTANQNGIVAVQNSHLLMLGKNVISNNRGFGIEVSEASSAEIVNDTVNSTRIDGNGNDGLSVDQSSAVQMTGGEIVNNKLSGVQITEASSIRLKDVKITGNGSPAFPALSAISVEGNSHLLLTGGLDISGNAASGIFVEDGAVLFSNGGNTISNNGIDGVLLKGMAVGHWLTPDTITGNARFSLHCDNTSLIEADVSGFPRGDVKCAHIAPR